MLVLDLALFLSGLTGVQTTVFSFIVARGLRFASAADSPAVLSGYASKSADH